MVFLAAILAAVVYLMVTKRDDINLASGDDDERIEPSERWESSAEKRFIGLGASAAAVALTIGLMTVASATGLAKSPSAATLLESDEAGGAAAADTGPTPAPGASSVTVDVTLSEWAIVPSVTSAKAGAITFKIKNAGPAKRHEFIILKTDLAPDALPLARDKSLNESGTGVTSPGEGGILAVGKSESVTVNMAPGNYVFVDNIVESGLVHWANKAYATLIVEPSTASPNPVSTASASAAAPTASAPPTISTTGSAPGGTAHATAKAAPGLTCTIVYVHPSGKTSVAAGLDPAVVGPDGVASWSWLISATTTPLGDGTVTVTCGGVSASAPIKIG